MSAKENPDSGLDLVFHSPLSGLGDAKLELRGEEFLWVPLKKRKMDR